MGPGADPEPVLEEPISAELSAERVEVEVSDEFGDDEAAIYGYGEPAASESAPHEPPAPEFNPPGAWGDDQSSSQSSGRRGLFGR